MPRQIGGFLARAEYLPIAAGVRMFAATPLPAALKIGAAMGAVAMHLDRLNRPIALKNLEIAFPDLTIEQRLAILRGMYRNLGRMAAEWTHFERLQRANIQDYVSYDTIENLNRVLEAAREYGVLVLTAHFGNFELLALAHSVYGNRIAIVHRPLRNPFLDHAVRDARIRCGNQVIARKNAGAAMLGYLRNKWQVAVALDLDVRRGVFVDFFGMKACTSEGVARLAMAAQAGVAPAFMVRAAAGIKHRITVLPLIEMVKTRDREESIRENTQRMTTVIEQIIRRYPDHWNWIHRRWKTRPAGESRFY